MFSNVAGKAPALAKAPQQPHWAVRVHFSSPAFQEDDFKQTNEKRVTRKQELILSVS